MTFCEEIQFNTKLKKEKQNKFPAEVSFLARLKIDKARTTLAIDEEEVFDKQKNRFEPGFVHREATHTYKQEFEKIEPNPDKNDKRPMFLKRPRKLAKYLFKPHNKNLTMPSVLKDKYSQNNKKKE